MKKLLASSRTAFVVALLLAATGNLYGQWSFINMPETRAFPYVTALGDNVYLTGGGDNSAPYSKYEIYNSTTNTWSSATLQSKSDQRKISVPLSSGMYFVKAIQGTQSLHGRFDKK